VLSLVVSRDCGNLAMSMVVITRDRGDSVLSLDVIGDRGNLALSMVVIETVEILFCLWL
jgi:hypothetical protein